MGALCSFRAAYRLPSTLKRKPAERGGAHACNVQPLHTSNSVCKAADQKEIIRVVITRGEASGEHRAFRNLQPIGFLNLAWLDIPFSSHDPGPA